MRVPMTRFVFVFVFFFAQINTKMYRSFRISSNKRRTVLIGCRVY